MTIRVSPERTTLSLPPGRFKTEDARGPAQTARPSGPGSPAGATAGSKGADVSQLRADGAVLDRASSIADKALAAADTVKSLLEQMRDRLSESGGDERFRNLGQLVSEAVRGAGFDGVNLLDGSQGGPFRVPLGGEGSEPLTLPVFDLSPSRDLNSSDRGAAQAAVDSAIVDASDARERLSENAKKVEAHRSFVSMLAQALGDQGAEPSLGVESARLAALQLRQTLGDERFSIANQAPQTVLALFR